MTIARDLSKILDANGDLNIDANTLFVDSSTNSVGIGTSSPAYNLDIVGQTGSLSRLRVQNNGTLASDSSVLQLGIAGTTAESLIYFGDSGDSNAGQLRYDHASDYLSIHTAGSERMRIASSGNVTIGTTNSTNLSVSAEDGIALGNSGFGVFSRANNTPLYIQRRTNDGDLISFTKDGTTVGSIGAFSGDVTIGNDDVGIVFGNGGNGLFPYSPTDGNYKDNHISLGNGSYRWRHLYLGGSVYLGGTGSANALDDYEEGTWTPVFLGGGSNPTVSYNTQEGRYTKIGNLVYVQAYALVNTTSGGSGNLRLGGLPFTAVNASSRGFASIALTNIESTIVVTQLIDPNSTYSILRKGNQPPAEIQVSDLANGEYLWYSGVYQVS